MIERMIRGLNATLKDKITPQQYHQFNKAVEAYRIIENSLNHQMLMRLVSLRDLTRIEIQPMAVAIIRKGKGNGSRTESLIEETTGATQII